MKGAGALLGLAILGGHSFVLAQMLGPRFSHKASCIHVPILDTTVAIQSARKTDSRSGLQADASFAESFNLSCCSDMRSVPSCGSGWAQPEGLSDSSRWSQRSADHRTTIENDSTPGKGVRKTVAPLRGTDNVGTAFPVVAA
jgi:hypothetical protein